LWTFADFYQLVVPPLRKALKESGETTILDLCSGAGGPVAPILQELKKENPSLQARLSDLFPNVAAYERIKQKEGIDFVPYSLDATNVKEKGFRTMFAAYHHFDDDLARKILQVLFCFPFFSLFSSSHTALPSPLSHRMQWTLNLPLESLKSRNVPC
jgi:hypothetical protein